MDKEGNKVHLSDNLSATLVGAGTCTFATPVTTSTTMEILADMALVPQLSVLPWDPVAYSQYTVKHVLNGGNSPLNWSSSNTSISTTNQLGMSSVSGSFLVSSTMTVAKSRASHCKA